MGGSIFENDRVEAMLTGIANEYRDQFRVLFKCLDKHPFFNHHPQYLKDFEGINVQGFPPIGIGDDKIHLFLTLRFPDRKTAVTLFIELSFFGEEQYFNLYLTRRRSRYLLFDVFDYCKQTGCPIDHKIEPGAVFENEVSRILGSGLTILEEQLGQYVDGWTVGELPEIESMTVAELQSVLEDETFDLNATDHNGLTLLNHAVRQGRTNLIEVLLQNGADANCGAVRCVLNLKSKDQDHMVQMIETLIQAGADPDEAQLFPAAKTPPGFMDLSVDFDGERNTPLQEAADLGLQKVVRCLLRNGAKNVRSFERWHPAVRQIIGSALGRRF